MKAYSLVFVFCAGLVLHGCGESLLDSRYALELPDIPQNWAALLGSPCWKVEWLNEGGWTETMTVQSGKRVEISLPQTWANAVSAVPFWPNKGIGLGIFRPAGAIFPFDVSGKSLILSWQGGVDANLYWELARAYARQESPPQTTVPRLPQNFDWPRFRLLFEDPSLKEDVRADPWLADWPGIAEKIVQSGFDKRRLVAEARSNLIVPVSPGPWIGTSPFAAPLLFESVPIFPVRPAADTWVCAEGILRCNAQTWIFLEW